MTYDLEKLRRMTDAELAELADNGLMNTVCERDDLPTLRYLAGERRLPVERENNETLPLMAAAEYGSTKMVDYLLSLGADIDCLTDDEWHTPLIRAALADRPHMVLHLLRKGADPNVGECCDDVVFCMLYYPDVLRAIMAAGGDPDIRNTDWETPLDRCVSESLFCAERNPENAEAVRAQGVRVDHDLSEAMEILIEYGASPYFARNKSCLPDTPNGRRMQALIQEEKRHERASYQLYVNLRSWSNPRQYFLSALRHFAEKGVDLREPSPWKGGAQLLWYAVRFGDMAALEFLLSKGCTWDAEEDYIRAALSSRNVAMLKRMFREGMLPKHPGQLWQGLYQEFKSSQDRYLAWLPIERGWLPEPKHTGYTVLHDLAARPDDAESLKLFRAYVERLGLNPDAASHTGKTPRDIATEQNFTALLNYLDSRRNA